VAEKISPKPGDKRLSEAELLAGGEVTSGDVGRALAKWRRRVLNFEARLKQAADEVDNAD